MNDFHPLELMSIELNKMAQQIGYTAKISGFGENDREWTHKHDKIDGILSHAGLHLRGTLFSIGDREGKITQFYSGGAAIDFLIENGYEVPS